ncbi:MOSC domain-containing protein [Sulfitobacter sp. BDSS02]|nr:MOSC domain-containing protein [Sulfitobacter sp. BDSS02]MBR9852293.1 MOSC domain-containing protein [Paracoccaceae bacterium]
MTGTVTSIWRHPIKSHGREELSEVTLAAGMTMPGDRVWAVAHENSKADNTAWARPQSFSIVSRNPALMAISAQLDDANNKVTLFHPELSDLNFDPDTEAQAFLDWVAPLVPEGRAAPARIVRVPGRGMTDTKLASVTLCNMASHREVEKQVGHELSILRWRGNIWFDGIDAWEELAWVDRDVRIGEAVLRVHERTERCPSTKSNPDTGKHDVDTLAALNAFGHQDFSVRAEVITPGTIRPGDRVEVI